MANRTPDSAAFASLSQQVTNLDGDYRDLKGMVITLDRKLDTSMAAISQKLDDSRQPAWQAYGVMLTAITIIGALAYWPVRENQTELRETIKTLATGVVYTRRYENNMQNVKEELEKLRTEKASKDLENERTENAQRQIEELKDAVLTLTPRAATIDLRARVQALESRK